MIPDAYKTYLLVRGAGTTAHSGYTLWAHLAGVHRILVETNSDADVCNAGLFHSVYGTAAFKSVTAEPSARGEVRELIGSSAEDLVWAFCNLPRPQLFEASLATREYGWLDTLDAAGPKSEVLKGLLRLECANLLEQRMLYQFPQLTRHAQEIGLLDADGFCL